MSASLKKAIGYAMPWHKFEEETLLECEAHLTRDALDDIFFGLSDADLTVDDETYKWAWHTDHVMSISEKRLLSTTYTEGNRRPAVIGSPCDLFALVWDEFDENSDIIFFPNLNYQKSWYRSRDELDWQFERWHQARGRRDEPDSRIFRKYVPYGFGPWTNSLMTIDGNPEPWISFIDLYDRPDLVPQVPHEIRWYLKKFGILDDKGVNQLRPLVAQWWS